ncbi:MAG: AAA family ATPase [Blastocatellales bacterium]
MSVRLISSIKLQGLFGLYDYNIPKEGTLSDATILYGDNGVGKSTILRLAFHLLSAANNRGHRTQLYKTEFQRIEVMLSSGTMLSAHVSKAEPVKVLTFEVKDKNKIVAAWDYCPQDYRPAGQANLFDDEIYLDTNEHGEMFLRKKSFSKKSKKGDDVPRGEQAYLEALKQRVPALFILTADRRLDSDAVSDPSDEVELRRVMQYDKPKSINDLARRSREIALSQALYKSFRWLNRQAVRGTNQGSTNVHQVYTQVITKLVPLKDSPLDGVKTAEVSKMLDQLTHIDKRSEELATYELSTHLPTDDFKKALRTKRKNQQRITINLLEPYIASLQSRLSAIEPIYQLIDRFINIVNQLLKDKEIKFKLSQGFIIINKLGTQLEPAQLSSGEQQLLLLFSYVLTARETPTVFMIDEPEISLNIKWQRQLIHALLDITEGASIQFMFASHSMELIAQHRQRVVKLENTQ